MSIISKQQTNSVCFNDKIINRDDCEHCVLREKMLFSDIEMDKLADWTFPIHKKIFDAKTLLYRQGQLSDKIFSIRRGFIKLSRYNENGSESIVRLLGPGSCAGLEALMQDEYLHQAQAITEVDFCVIPIKTIALIEKEQPQLYKNLMQQWQSQLHQADEWHAKLLSGTIKERLCHLLLFLNDMQKFTGNKVLLLANQDIASMLSTTEESISRCISDFRKQKVITRIEQRNYQLDIDRIQQQLK